MDLVDIIFPVIPYSIVRVVVIVFASMYDVGRVAFDPFVPLVVFKMKCPGDMSLDEECADAA